MTSIEAPSIVSNVGSGLLPFRIPPDGVAEGLEVNRLGDVGLEAGLAAALHVLFLSEPAEGDAADLAGPQAAHDVGAAAVGQADVADEQIEFSLFTRLDCLVHRADGRDRAT